MIIWEIVPPTKNMTFKAATSHSKKNKIHTFNFRRFFYYIKRIYGRGNDFVILIRHHQNKK